MLQGLTPAAIWWALTGTLIALWHPLGSLSLMVDHALFGLHPTGYHAMAVLLHIGSVLLLFLALRHMTGASWRPALVAALFAVHPLRVESVVWISERKDVLAVLCGVASLLMYSRYVKDRRWGWYAASLALLAFSMSAKPLLMTFPFLLLLLDAWPLQRWEWSLRCTIRLAAEKLPFLFVVLLLLIPNLLLVHHSGSAAPTVFRRASTFDRSFAERLATVPISYVRYLWRMIWFGDLTFIYPMQRHPAAWQTTAALLALALVTALALWQWRRPWLIVGWCWFLGTLLPVSGVVPIGAYDIADRYTYFPSIGLLIMLVWSIPSPRKYPRGRHALVFGIAGVLLGLTVNTWVQISTWRDTASLCRHALTLGENQQAYMSLGGAQLDAGHPSLAEVAERQALALDPSDIAARMVLIRALDEQNRFTDAASIVTQGAALIPENLPFTAESTDAWGDRVAMPAVVPRTQRDAFVLQAKLQQARDQFALAAAAEAQADKAGSSHQVAIDHYRAAAALSPQDPEIWYNLGNCLQQDDDLDGAIAAYRQAIAFQPTRAEAHFNLAIALIGKKNIPEAEREAELLRRLDANLYAKFMSMISPPR